MSTIMSTALINVLRPIIARFGPPDLLVTNNVTQFTSSIFKKFCKKLVIEQTFSLPYHPQSNGQAKRFVETLKRSLIKFKGRGEMSERIQELLFSYCSRHCSSAHDGEAPVFFGRMPRNILIHLLPTTTS